MHCWQFQLSCIVVVVVVVVVVLVVIVDVVDTVIVVYIFWLYLAVVVDFIKARSKKRISAAVPLPTSEMNPVGNFIFDTIVIMVFS